MKKGGAEGKAASAHSMTFKSSKDRLHAVLQV